MKKKVLGTMIAGAALGGVTLLAVGPAAVFADDGRQHGGQATAEESAAPQSGAKQSHQPSGERSGAEESGAEKSRSGGAQSERSGDQRSGGAKSEQSGDERSGGAKSEESGAEKSRSGGQWSGDERSGDERSERSGDERSWNNGEERDRKEVFTVEIRPEQAAVLHLSKNKKDKKGDNGDHKRTHGLGDELVFSGSVARDTRQLGVADGVCTLTHKSRAGEDVRAQCLITLSFEEGQLTLQGVVPIDEEGPSTFFDLAITGGTGKFRTAAGYTANTVIDKRLTISEIHLEKLHK